MNISSNQLQLTTFLTALLLTMAAGMSLFSVSLVEKDNSRMIATSNYNYALTSPLLASKNWRTVSVNGNSVTIVTTSGEIQQKQLDQIGLELREFINTVKEDIANGNTAFSQMSGSNSMGGGNMMMSSSGGSGSFSTSSSSGFSTTSNGGQININAKDDNNYSISKTDLPFNWSQIFVNNDLVTVVTKSGEVYMRPISLMEAAQQAALATLKEEVRKMQQAQAKQFHDTMQNSMNMVSNIFGNIMGNLPKPPAFNSAVGDTFGNNFPFGPNNSPFSAASGWPFAGSSFAFAGRRR